MPKGGGIQRWNELKEKIQRRDDHPIRDVGRDLQKWVKRKKERRHMGEEEKPLKLSAYLTWKDISEKCKKKVKKVTRELEITVVKKLQPSKRGGEHAHQERFVKKSRCGKTSTSVEHGKLSALAQRS